MKLFTKKIPFMANNGFRQLGEPRMNVFTDKQMPDPLHLKINNWDEILNQECVQRDFINILVNLLKLGREGVGKIQLL